MGNDILIFGSKAKRCWDKHTKSDYSVSDGLHKSTSQTSLMLPSLFCVDPLTCTGGVIQQVVAGRYELPSGNTMVVLSVGDHRGKCYYVPSNKDIIRRANTIENSVALQHALEIDRRLSDGM